MRRTTACKGLTAAGVALAALTLAACENTQLGGPPPPVARPYGYFPPPPPAPPRRLEGGFSAQEFAWSAGTGAGALGGRVAYHAVSGERWTCLGQTVALIPATRYSADRMAVLYGSRERAVVPKTEVQARNAAEPGVDYGTYVRTARCEAHDAFNFAGLPVGAYFLIAGAHPRGHAPGPSEGVVIMQRVDVAPGPTRIVVPQP